MKENKLRELTEKVISLENLRRRMDDLSVLQQITRLESLVEQIFGEKLSIAALEEVLRRKKVREEHLSRRVIPELLDEVGISEYTTAEGMRVSISDVVRASISQGNAQAVCGELTRRYEMAGFDHHMADSASREDLSWCIVSSDPAARMALADLPHQEKFRPHHMRMSRMVREWLDAGEDIPDGISWATYRETKIKRKDKNGI